MNFHGFFFWESMEKPGKQKNFTNQQSKERKINRSYDLLKIIQKTIVKGNLMIWKMATEWKATENTDQCLRWKIYARELRAWARIRFGDLLNWSEVSKMRKNPRWREIFLQYITNILPQKFERLCVLRFSAFKYYIIREMRDNFKINYIVLGLCWTSHFIFFPSFYVSLNWFDTFAVRPNHNGWCVCFSKSSLWPVSSSFGFLALSRSQWTSKEGWQYSTLRYICCLLVATTAIN